MEKSRDEGENRGERGLRNGRKEEARETLFVGRDEKVARKMDRVEGRNEKKVEGRVSNKGVERRDVKGVKDLGNKAQEEVETAEKKGEVKKH